MTDSTLVIFLQYMTGTKSLYPQIQMTQPKSLGLQAVACVMGHKPTAYA